MYRAVRPSIIDVKVIVRVPPLIFSSSTYFLGQRRGFNDQLNDTTKRFTYFVPYDYAWNVAMTRYPSTYKKLFMPEFSYHVSNNVISREISDRRTGEIIHPAVRVV